MKKTLIAATSAILLLSATGAAMSQAVSVTVAPEERTRIKEYVVKERVAPVTVRERISVGARLPADVELHSVPATWGERYSKYRYVYSNDNVYLVEPSSREVIQVID